MASRRKKTAVPRTANDEFLDAMLRHQVGLERTSKGLGRRVRELLDASESDLKRAIRRRLRNHTGLETPASVRRLQRLLDEVKKIRGESHAEVAALLHEEMIRLAALEPAIVDGILKTVVPVVLDTAMPAAPMLRSIVTTRPFEGKVLKEWARDIARADLARIESQIRIGMVQGESIPQISRRIVGKASLRGRDGVTQIARRNAEALARTATNHVANEARREYHKANDDILDDELFLATLDSVTTPICRSLDGKRFPIGEGPRLPLHWNERSLRVAILDAEALGRRPSKPVSKRSLLRDFAAEEKLDRVPLRRADLPHGTKGRFDAFSRARTRELIGRVPAKVDYQTWLGRQSAKFQDDVLGKAKGKLFRRGDLSLDKFVDPATFKEVTLDSLARTEAEAFRAAGLDPEDFLR